MRALRRIRVNSKKTVITIVVSIFILLTGLPALAQSIPSDFAAKLDQARKLEREIADLEDQLAIAQRDWLATAQRLEDVEKKILDCYLKIDAAEQNVDNARRELNSSLRSMYVDGQRDALVEMFSASDISEFVTKYDYMTKVAQHQADAYKVLKAKRDKLRKTQEQLQAFKREQASLAAGSKVTALESLISQKKGQLADLDGALISSQVPSTLSPTPTDFNPDRVFSQPDENAFVSTGQILSGYSSWYGNEFDGKPTSSGEVFNQYGFTCAHKTLPFGTWLRVTFLGRSVIVRVNDRGPFVKGRMLDLSRGAAEAIGLSGVEWVDCEIVVPK
jgi:rare lipoprotein A (peptidoglycan hydrolase)